MKKEISAFAYLRPSGVRVQTMISDIYPDDADYIISKGIGVSLESDGDGNVIMYFCYGFDEENAAPLEHIEITEGLDKREAIKKAVEALKEIELEIQSENHG